MSFLQIGCHNKPQEKTLRVEEHRLQIYEVISINKILESLKSIYKSYNYDEDTNIDNDKNDNYNNNDDDEYGDDNEN